MKNKLVTLLIMDGFGINPNEKGNAIAFPRNQRNYCVLTALEFMITSLSTQLVFKKFSSFICWFPL